MKKLLLLSGVGAAIIYLGTVILGGLLRPGYIHLSMAISELVADGAPNRTLLSSLFLSYNVLTSLFGLGLFLRVKSQSQGQVTGSVGSLALITVGMAGILMELAFPQETGGTATTFAGTMHFVMAGVASLGTMVAILMMAFWFKNVPELKGYVTFSMMSVTVIFISGGLTAAAMANHSLLFGLIERITILTFILWMLITGRKMAQQEESPHQAGNFEIAELTSKGN